MADTVLVYRSRARGKQSSYGKDPKQGGRYWEKLATSLPGLNQWHVPQGLVSAFQEMAMIAMRHRIDYGTTDDHYADVAIAFREHAMRNPNAVMRAPMTREDHHASRMIADPLRLYDCNIETDGAVAFIVTIDRARARPAPAAGGDPRRRDGRGLAPHPPLDACSSARGRTSRRSRVARQLYEMAGVQAARRSTPRSSTTSSPRW